MQHVPTEPKRVLLSFDEYLATTYRPDCDYIDGELQERNLGTFDHSNFQGALIECLYKREREWNTRSLPGLRLRVSATRVRIPDVCILSRDQPIEEIITQPPLVCIEILSEGDTLRSTRPRLDDYREFGVPNLWVFDPTKLEAWAYDGAEFVVAPEVLAVADSAIEIRLAELFSYLD